MNRSRLLMIGGLALAVGLLVSFSVYNRLRSLAGSNSNERGIRVIVAAHDILVGTKLDTPDLASITIPESAVPPGAYYRLTKVLDAAPCCPWAKANSF